MVSYGTFVVYGNNGKWEGDYWVMDTDKDAPTGDLSEACGNTSYYRIHRASMVSRQQIGFCTNLSGWPAKWEVRGNGKIVTEIDATKELQPTEVLRIVKTDQILVSLDEDVAIPTVEAKKATQRVELAYCHWDNSFNPDHLHFEAPTHISFYDNGDISLYTKHIAHFRRSDLFTEKSFNISYQFIDRHGNAVQSNEWSLDRCTYGTEKDNVRRDVNDPWLAEHHSEIDWSKSSNQRHIRSL